jgi:hypothetical protein
MRVLFTIHNCYTLVVSCDPRKMLESFPLIRISKESESKTQGIGGRGDVPKGESGDTQRLDWIGELRGDGEK